MYVIVP